jgi:class 3 adenylate cyclase
MATEPIKSTGARWIAWAGYALCAATGLSLHFSGWLESADRKLLDAGFAIERSYFRQPANNDVVIVGIDEAFLREAPEPLALLHEHLAKLFEAVAAGGPRAVGLDIVLPEKSFSFLVPADRPDFDFDRALAHGLLKLGAAAPLVVGETWDHARSRFHDIHPAFLAAASQWVAKRGPENFDNRGSALVCPDADGVVREYPGAACQPGGATRTLAERLVSLMDRPGEWRGFINYGIGGPFAYIPGRDLIAWQRAGDVARLAQIKDKLVLVGAVLDNDDRLMAPLELAQWEPGNHRVPGVTLQAQMLRSMMNQGLVQPAPLPLMLALIAAGGAFFLGGRWRLKLALYVGFAVAVLLAALLLLRASVFLPPLAILAAGALSLAASGIVAARGYWQERQYLTRTFAGYVSPQVMKGILSGALSQGQAGEKRRVCVLFSDIRGFTALSEQLPPAVVVRLLNRYFDRMTQIVHAHGGSVDKFIGDGMMALFGAPQPLACPEKNALETASAMLLALVELNATFRTEGLPAIHIGIGVHSGDAVIGHVGSRERHEYTAIGDAVNVAARVCDLPKLLGVPIVCSETVAAAVGHPGFLADKGMQPLKGHTDMRVFGWTPEFVEMQDA